MVQSHILQIDQLQSLVLKKNISSGYVAEKGGFIRDGSNKVHTNIAINSKELSKTITKDLIMLLYTMM